MTAWCDAPGPRPTRRRRPFEDLLVELAERTGRPLWRVSRVGVQSLALCDCGGRPRMGRPAVPPVRRSGPDRT